MKNQLFYNPILKPHSGNYFFDLIVFPAQHVLSNEVFFRRPDFYEGQKVPS